MHEFSLATQIVENVLEFARARRTGEVLTVRLQIGELTSVETEQLRFCFNSITRETLLKNSQLEIESVSAAVRCGHCHYQGAPKYWKGALWSTAIPTLQCPQCGRVAHAIRGHECEIKSVRFEQHHPTESFN